MRKAAIKIEDRLAGWLTQDEQGYHFVYDKAYIAQPDARPVSLTLPVQEAAFNANILFPFFDGLIPEGLFESTLYNKTMKITYISAFIKVTF